MCAASGKIFLTQVIYTFEYLFRKFHDIIFHIRKTTVTGNSGHVPLP